MSTLIKNLIEFGLTEKEAKAYLVLLELEIAGVNEIAKMAGINRSSAYVTLEGLKKQGLVSISEDKNVRRYVATPPEAILRIAKDVVASKESVLKKIESIVPDMKALYKGTRKKPTVKVYEGKEGLITTFEDTLKTKEKLMRVISCPQNLGPLLSDYLFQYVSKRYVAGVRMRGIHPDDELNQALKKNDTKKIDMPVLIPKKLYNLKADLAIYDDKIGYMSGKDGGLAIVIESKEIADVMKTLFDFAYEESKRLAREQKKRKEMLSS